MRLPEAFIVLFVALCAFEWGRLFRRPIVRTLPEVAEVDQEKTAACAPPLDLGEPCQFRPEDMQEAWIRGRQSAYAGIYQPIMN